MCPLALSRSAIMSESGDQSHKSRSNRSVESQRFSKSGVLPRESPPHRQGRSDPQRNEQSRVGGSGSRDSASKQDSITLWQRLFGQGSQRSRKASSRQAAANGTVGGQRSLSNSVRDDLELSRDRFRSLRVDRDRGSDSADRRVGSASLDNGRQVSTWRSRPDSASRQNGITQFPVRDRQVAQSTDSSETWRGNGHRERSLRSAAKESNARPLNPMQPSTPIGEQDASRLALLRGQRRSGAMMPIADSGTAPVNPLVAEASKNRRVRSRQRNGSPSAPKRRSRAFAAMLYTTRLLILSVGVGVLAGTILSVWDPANRSLTSQQPVKQAGVGANTNQEQASVTASLAHMTQSGQEMSALKNAMQALIMKNTQMTPGIFVMDLDTNNYVDVNGGAVFASASTIKVPILVAFFQEVDAGKIRLDEPLVLQKELIGSGSGDMQYATPGTKYAALEVATKMITISDNTATNLIIARLGGIRALNQRFKTWGLNATVLNNLLPDLEGTNTTTPKELSFLMNRISQGELVSMRSRDRMLDIMRRTENNSQLGPGLGAGASIAHKTGDIGSLIGDTGLIDLPNGKRYLITVLVKRSHNDDRAYDFVSQFSRLAYLYFTRPPVAAKNPPAGASPTSPTGQPSPAGNSNQENSGDSGADSTQG